MLTPDFLRSKFAAALPYPDYVRTGTPDQQSRWALVHDLASLTPAQRALAASFTRDLYVLVLSGVWCGDCVQQCPLLARIAESNPAKIHLRFLDRDEHPDLAAHLKINGGARVPVALFLSEDFELCSTLGDRTLSRYRALAAKQLGPSCPTGLGAPDQPELASTLQDWLNEFERTHLMLRLSPRLRQRHND
jgi:thiol-disulfide isomerase/thioredoxin